MQAPNVASRHSTRDHCGFQIACSPESQHSSRCLVGDSMHWPGSRSFRDGSSHWTRFQFESHRAISPSSQHSTRDHCGFQMQAPSVASLHSTRVHRGFQTACSPLSQHSVRFHCGFQTQRDACAGALKFERKRIAPIWTHKKRFRIEHSSQRSRLDVLTTDASGKIVPAGLVSKIDQSSWRIEGISKFLTRLFRYETRR